MNRRNWLVLLLGTSALLSACSDKSEEEKRPIVRPVLSVLVEPSSKSQLSFAGSIQPQVSAQLSFRLLGRMVSRDVDVGDLVKKGETLAALDPTALQLSVQGARADLTSAQAQLANATASQERQRLLLESRNIPQATYDSAMQAQAAAQAGVDQAQAELAKVQEQLGYAQLYSDFDGIITQTGAEVGQTVSAGQMIVTVARTEGRDAVIDVPQQSLPNFTMGSEFDVVVQSAPQIKARCRVREIAPQADEATRTRRIKLGLIDPPQGFRLGATVTVQATVDVVPQIILPHTALLEENGKAQVWVVDPAARTVSLQPVQVAPAGNGSFVVTSGLDPGSRVVTAGVHSLTQGQAVKLDFQEPPP